MTQANAFNTFLQGTFAGNTAISGTAPAPALPAAPPAAPATTAKCGCAGHGAKGMVKQLKTMHPADRWATIAWMLAALYFTFLILTLIFRRASS